MTGVRKKVAKAFVEATVYNDYSRWKRKDGDNRYAMTFGLDLGMGYSLYAHPPGDYVSGPANFRLRYDGCFRFRFSGEFDGSSADNIVFRNSDGAVYVDMGDSLDAEEYARSIEGKVSCRNIRYTDREGRERKAHAFRSKRPYAGCREKPSEGEFDWEFKRDLLKAVYMQDFSGLGDDREETTCGLHFTVTDTEEVRYCTRYSVSVYGDNDDPIYITFKGVLTRNDEGIAIMGDHSSMTIPVSGEEMERFRRETGFPTPEEYLDSHPYVSYRGIAEKFMDEADAIRTSHKGE